ncbi:hypothetical protein GCM10025863_11100 [Microbacterium suwonense]|uniref:Uncharacterized protein n=1 Tax=Microbacterium suwonense TaxID=683047 RepID=A0ABN6X1C1_9MICO|nr:hypothetical protein GCM10025863_11100 [Microbacterium suwonense]
MQLRAEGATESDAREELMSRAKTQIAVPKRSHTPVITYPPVMVFRFDEVSFDSG